MAGQTLAQRVRAKYPGAYQDLTDQQLEGGHPAQVSKRQRWSANDADESTTIRTANVQGIRSRAVERSIRNARRSGHGLAFWRGRFGQAGFARLADPSACRDTIVSLPG
jgi:hypothetical protein